MSSTREQYDPELLEILGEMSADPKSMLLKMAATKSMTGRGLYDRPISVGESFLTNAEQRLLQRHREEMAALLYDACRLVLESKPVTESRIYWGDAPISLEAWRGKASRELARAQETESGDVLLVRSMIKDGTRGADAVDLCRASLRIHPCNKARNRLILALRSAGELDEALELAESIISWVCLKPLLAKGHSNRGHVLDGCGRKEEARQSFEAACKLDSRPAQYHCNWFGFELMKGDKASITSCAVELNQHVDSADPAARAYVTVLNSHVGQGLWDPSRESVSVVPLVREGLSGIARLIANVLP